MRLTDAAVAQLTVPEGKTEIIVFDDMLAGFGVRVRKGGSKRYVFQYKLSGVNRRVTFKETDVKRARAAAQILAAKITLGTDPALEKEAAHDAAGDTFGRCLSRYQARPQGRRRPSTLREIKRHLERNLASLHRLHIKKLDRRRLADELARLTVESGPTQSNRTRASLSKFLNWCIGEGYVDTNVALQTNKNEEVPRNRVLSDGELLILWNTLSPPGDDFADIIRLLILTGQRLREISELHWFEVDFDKKTITLPPSRTKNHRQHIVPLSEPALAILKGREQNGRAYIFGRGNKGFSGWSKSKTRLDERARLNQPWILHDIRRSTATGLATLGVQPHVIEAVLGHVSGFRAGVAGRYNLAAYEAEKRAALELWGRHLLGLVADPQMSARKAVDI
jgi:integrase